MKIDFHSWNGSYGYFFFGIFSDNEYHHVGIQLIARRYKDWQWGYENIYYDGDHHSFSLGPLGMVTWD